MMKRPLLIGMMIMFIFLPMALAEKYDIEVKYDIDVDDTDDAETCEVKAYIRDEDNHENSYTSRWAEDACNDGATCAYISFPPFKFTEGDRDYYVVLAFDEYYYENDECVFKPELRDVYGNEIRGLDDISDDDNVDYKDYEIELNDLADENIFDVNVTCVVPETVVNCPECPACTCEPDQLSCPECPACNCPDCNLDTGDFFEKPLNIKVDTVTVLILGGSVIAAVLLLYYLATQNRRGGGGQQYMPPGGGNYMLPPTK